MQEQRARYLSNDSTLASYSEPGSCYEEMLRYISHLYRKVKRRASRIYSRWQSKRRERRWTPTAGWVGEEEEEEAAAVGGPMVTAGTGVADTGFAPSTTSSNSTNDSTVTSAMAAPVLWPLWGPARLWKWGPSQWGRNWPCPHSQPPCTMFLPGLSQCTAFIKVTFRRPRKGERAPRWGVPALGRLNGGMNYPTILPSLICSYTGSSSAGKGRRVSDGNTGCDVIDPYEKLHQLMGEHSEFS